MVKYRIDPEVEEQLMEEVGGDREAYRNLISYYIYLALHGIHTPIELVEEKEIDRRVQMSVKAKH